MRGKNLKIRDIFREMQLSLVNWYKFYFVFYTRFVLGDTIYICQWGGEL